VGEGDGHKSAKLTVSVSNMLFSQHFILLGTCVCQQLLRISRPILYPDSDTGPRWGLRSPRPSVLTLFPAPGYVTGFYNTLLDVLNRFI